MRFVFLALLSLVAPGAFAADWDPNGLQALSDYVFSEGHHKTDAFLIQDGSGRTILERYARGYTPEMRHFGWSITKSISMAIFGIAEAEGRISSSDPVSKYVPELAGKHTIWDRVTFKHLLSMSSGVKWAEGYEWSPFSSNIVAALYRTGPSADFGLYRASVDQEIAPPGKRFNYASGETNLLMRGLKVALGKDYDEYPWKKLFDPVGMSSAVLEKDPSGTFIGSSYGLATPRDFAKFGQLFLHAGRIREGNGKVVQVVPEKWAKLASTPSPAFDELRLDHVPEEPYGYSWWLNRPLPAAQIGKRAPSFPDDLYFASGHYGQLILVIPSWDLVVVRLGLDGPGKKIDLEEMGRLIGRARK